MWLPRGTRHSMLQSAETNGRKGGPATTAHPARGSGRSRPSIGQGLKQLGSLAFQERRVILLLRAMAAPGDAPAGSERHASPQPALREGFELLAREAIANGLSIFAPGSAFVNDDELAILSRLTLFQRPSQSGEWELANDFQKALKTCADELENEGRRLPPRPRCLRTTPTATPASASAMWTARFPRNPGAICLSGASRCGTDNVNRNPAHCAPGRSKSCAATRSPRRPSSWLSG